MKRRRGIRAGALAVVACAALTGGSALGQDTAVTCTLEPLEVPLFGGTPVAVFATPSPDSSPVVVDLSLAETEEVLQQYVACTNTGEPTLVWAVFTPRWFAQTFADPAEHYLPAFEQMLDQDGQPAEIPLELVEVIGIESHRGAVDVTATFRSGEQEWTDTLTLVQVDGQWLIDDVQPINPPAGG